MAADIETYKLKKDSNELVKLSVTIGHGQLGVTRIYKGVEAVLPDITGSFRDFELGDNVSLNDENRKIDIVVKDVNQITDQTSVTIELTGGEEDVTYEKKPIMVEQSGGYAYYLTVIYFYREN
jgi:hypothetical protein